jgi:hypothetical protein
MIKKLLPWLLAAWLLFITAPSADATPGGTVVDSRPSSPAAISAFEI